MWILFEEQKRQLTLEKKQKFLEERLQKQNMAKELEKTIQE